MKLARSSSPDAYLYGPGSLPLILPIHVETSPRFPEETYPNHHLETAILGPFGWQEKSMQLKDAQSSHHPISRWKRTANVMRTFVVPTAEGIVDVALAGRMSARMLSTMQPYRAVL